MKDTLPARVRFGVFELELKSGELRNGDEKALLQEQPLQILRMLVERQPEIVSRGEILATRQKARGWMSENVSFSSEEKSVFS